MDLIKKHYEKILLGIVLVGLVVALGFLPFKISSEKDKQNELTTSVMPRSVKPLTNLDLSIQEASLKRAATPAILDFSTTNKLFNPMAWQMAADNRLIRSDKTGPSSVLVTNIIPLYLKISLDAVTISADGTPRYLFGIENEAAPSPDKRKKTSKSYKVGEKSELFTFEEVKGPPNAPTAVVVKLNNGDIQVTIPNDKDKPWKRVDGYLADLRYELQNKSWPKQRVGAVINFNGEDYRIVGISKSEVTLLSPLEKKYTIRLNNA
jgi:hypothetical protein